MDGPSIAMESISYPEDGDKFAQLYFAKHWRNGRCWKKCIVANQGNLQDR